MGLSVVPKKELYLTGETTMEPIKKRIAIAVGNKHKRVIATCLGCFGVHREYDAAAPRSAHQRPYVITHLPTGLSLGGEDGSFSTQSAALDAIRDLSTLRDWTSKNTRDYRVPELREQTSVICRQYGGATVRVSFGGATPKRPINTHALRPCYID